MRRNMKQISRQRKDQIRHKKMGLCQQCSEPLWENISKTYCEKHAIWTREYYRKYTGAKKRNNNCQSYVMKKEK